MLREAAARQKVPGGKLLAVRLEYDERIESIQILGDFFVVPEDALPVIEEALVGASVGESESEISRTIAGVLGRHHIELIGISPEAIAQTIRMALK